MWESKSFDVYVNFFVFWKKDENAFKSQEYENTFRQNKKKCHLNQK